MTDHPETSKGASRQKKRSFPLLLELAPLSLVSGVTARHFLAKNSKGTVLRPTTLTGLGLIAGRHPCQEHKVVACAPRLKKATFPFLPEIGETLASAWRESSLGRLFGEVEVAAMASRPVSMSHKTSMDDCCGLEPFGSSPKDPYSNPQNAPQQRRNTDFSQASQDLKKFLASREAKRRDSDQELLHSPTYT